MPSKRKATACRHPRRTQHAVFGNADSRDGAYLRWCELCGALYCRDGWSDDDGTKALPGKWLLPKRARERGRKAR